MYVRITSQQSLSTALAERGWVVSSVRDNKTIEGELDRVANLLGKRVAGRAGAVEEVIQPTARGDAHPRSLSARFGLEALPLHVELSHRSQPCRYILLGCVEPGEPSAATMLLDWQSVNLTAEELCFLETAPILVRTGRRSFYSTLLPANRSYLRYDPGCIEAVDERGREAIKIVQRSLAEGIFHLHQWYRGDIVVIDNWRVLHGRAPTDYGSGRRLARILIDV